MISLYYNKLMKAGVVMQDGMPMLVITDEVVVDYEVFVENMAMLTRQTGKSSAQNNNFSAFLRCSDEALGWRRL